MADLTYHRSIRDLLGPQGDLYMRLRGFYRIGPDGTHEPEFGYRDMNDTGPRQPIQTEAADVLEALAISRAGHREAIAAIFAEDAPFVGIGASSYAKADRVLALLLQPRLTAASDIEAPGLRRALEIIAALPSGESEAVMQGHEEAYRAIERIVAIPASGELGEPS